MNIENEEHENEEPEEVQHDEDSYRVLMDGRWKLEDLYAFPHAFSQCYSFIYCFDTDLPARDRSRINDALAGYPWRGGYSYVNIYTVLFHQVPPRHRPEVKAISYASPGWLDLFLNVDVAIQVAKSVGILAGSAVAAAKAYATVMKYISQVSVERKRAQLAEMRLTQAQHKTFMSMCEDMAKFLGFKNVKELHERTGNPEVSLKLLAAHYRRTDQLVEFVKEGKASLPKNDR
ncbi:MAG: hypothetical protein IOC38_20045 [Burkholderia sp.]|uniref:hypothetical protein n=1 Tax=Burkholderia sp. TaxID=36773 RepID=UPI002587BD7F|nr:hypothetical protein [Burkholderia sp.]MCA3159976.1 hypothetical protein [Burkholderiales bacterium]MCA3173808.1 hypothetical protein [Burkholderiales bacterium]MCA3887337.1 hypothetical protein [Burkholderia sp.]